MQFKEFSSSENTCRTNLIEKVVEDAECAYCSFCVVKHSD